MSDAARRASTLASTAGALGRSALHPDRGRPRPAPSVSAPEARRVTIRWPRRYEWPPAATWVEGLRRQLGRRVALTRADIAQPHEGAVMIEVAIDRVSHPVAIDYSDYDRVLDEVAAAARLVFKMQYRREGYEAGRVVPGGYVPSRRHLAALLPGLRHERDHAPPRYAVYGRFGSGYAPTVRSAAVRALTEQDAFAYEGTLALRPYPEYLREAALSRICIDLPGNGELCHRLVEYLALGCCVVRPPCAVSLPVPLRDGEEIVYASDHEQGLVDACVGLLREPARIDAIAARARAYYDAHLRAERLADRYLRACLDELGSPPSAFVE